MKFKLATPITVGDLTNSVIVDELEVESLSVAFDPQVPVLSVVLLHRTSGWQHNVVYRDSSAVEFWARLCEQSFDTICNELLKKLVFDNSLPAGNIEPLVATPVTTVAA